MAFIMSRPFGLVYINSHSLIGRVVEIFKGSKMRFKDLQRIEGQLVAMLPCQTSSLIDAATHKVTIRICLHLQDRVV